MIVGGPALGLVQQHEDAALQGEPLPEAHPLGNQKTPREAGFSEGGPCRGRTYDLVIKSHLLYQLS